MRSKLLDSTGQKTWAIIFEAGEEAAGGLLQFAREQKLTASQVSAIGAFQEVELGFFEIERKEYSRIHIREQVEVLSLLGDVTSGGEGPKVHVHVVLGKRDGSAWGGHLVRGIVRPTLEVILTESPAHLRREHDPATGLALINPRLE